MSKQPTSLSFDTLRAANVERLKDSKYKLCESEWTPAHWMQATVGELGELANIMKKVDRGDFTLEEAREAIGKELADVQTYLDIMAHKLGIDLGMATIRKFNEVSDRIGSLIFIDKDGEWYVAASVQAGTNRTTSGSIGQP
jgi:NTP pyrophosphatase (non-canonical NTP hydrolase)